MSGFIKVNRLSLSQIDKVEMARGPGPHDEPLFIGLSFIRGSIPTLLELMADCQYEKEVDATDCKYRIEGGINRDLTDAQFDAAIQFGVRANQRSWDILIKKISRALLVAKEEAA